MTGREKLMLAVCAAVGMVGSAGAAMGQVSYSTAGSTYSQNFDSLPSSGSGTWVDNTTLPGWFAAVGETTHPATSFLIDTGTSNTGGLHDYGDDSSTDRALGSIGSGSVNNATNIYYGLMLVNNTSETLGSFTLSYFGEQWRQTPADANTLQFAFSTTATSVGDTAGFAPSASLNFTALKFGTATGPISGNDPSNRLSISATVPITGGWAPGTTLTLRWYDPDDGGSDQGLALDDLSFSAAAHVAMHNGTTLTVGGSKTAPQVDLGRVVAGFATNEVTVNLSSAGGATTYQDISLDGSVVNPPSGPVSSGGTTPIGVKIGASANPAPPFNDTSFSGHDITTQAQIQNTGEDNDSTVTVPLKAHAVLNRFVDNFDLENFQGAGDLPVDAGKMLVGSTKTLPVTLTTVNKQTSDYSTNSLTAVELLASTAPTGFIGGASSGYAQGTLSEGSSDIVFDDGGDVDMSRTITVTPLQSGLVKPGAAGGERSPGYLSIPLEQIDTAAGAGGDARVYVQGDFYAPAGVVGDETAVAPGGTVTLTNSLPDGDGSAGKRLGAEILGTSFDQSGWSVSGLPATIAASRAGYSVGGNPTDPVTPSVTATVAFNPAGKINGDYGATLSVALQNDQSAGVYGVAAHDLPDTTVPVAATVSSNPAVQSGSYTLDGGTLSAPATTLTGTFTQTGGASTFASLMGDGSVRVQGGSLTLSPGATANVVRSLEISGSGVVDLTTAKLAINYSGATPANAVRLALLAGSADGWTGATGLTSSDAAAHAADNYAIGYAEASKLFGAAGGTWNGATVDGTTLLIKETYFGDANLDGRVNADDLALLDRGFARQLAAGSARWTDGDFNYDGAVTMADYLLADTSFALHGGTLSPAFLAAREAEFGGAYVGNLLAAVPEPASLGLVGTAAAGLLGGRRRRRSGR